jgi:hypothetical protein
MIAILITVLDQNKRCAAVVAAMEGLEDGRRMPKDALWADMTVALRKLDVSASRKRPPMGSKRIVRPGSPHPRSHLRFITTCHLTTNSLSRISKIRLHISSAKLRGRRNDRRRSSRVQIVHDFFNGRGSRIGIAASSSTSRSMLAFRAATAAGDRSRGCRGSGKGIGPRSNASRACRTVSSTDTNSWRWLPAEQALRFLGTSAS